MLIISRLLLRSQSQSKGEDGTTVGIHAAGSRHHGVFCVNAKLPEFPGALGAGNCREERTDCSYAAEHGGVVHVLMGTVGVRANQTGLQGGVKFHTERTLRQICKEIRMSSFRAHCRRGGIVSLSQSFTYL